MSYLGQIMSRLAVLCAVQTLGRTIPVAFTVYDKIHGAGNRGDD